MKTVEHWSWFLKEVVEFLWATRSQLTLWWANVRPWWPS